MPYDWLIYRYICIDTQPILICHTILFFFYFLKNLFPYPGLTPVFSPPHTLVKTRVGLWMQAVCWLLCLSLAGASAVVHKDQVAQHAVKLYRSKRAAHGQSWVAGNCKRLVGLLRQKNVVFKKLEAAADAVGKDRSLSETEKHFQVPD